MLRTLLLAVFFTVCAAAAADVPIVHDFRQNEALEQRDVRYANGDVWIAATLLVPRDTDPHYAVVILPGSGFSTRSNVWAGMISQLLVGHGAAVLFPDKRASGESTGDLPTSDFTDLAKDALAGVHYLRKASMLRDKGLDIGLVGLSQGGRIAPLAAALAPEAVGFVINISGGATDGLESLRHERLNTYREMAIQAPWFDRFVRCDAIVDRLLVENEGWDDYVDCAGGFADGPYAEFAARIYPTDEDDWRLEWFSKVVAYDPLAHWRKVRQPAFIAYGADDEDENVPVGRSVELLRDAYADIGKKNYRIEVYEGVGHALWRRSGSGFEFAPAFVEDLGEWLATHGRR